MHSDIPWAMWSQDRQRRCEDVLGRLLPPVAPPAARLAEAMRYAVLGGGKRVRPLLAYAAGELSGANLDDVDLRAAAVELIHAYSLVHDDLPCMDDDSLRRGRATAHIAFDEATALLAGDALQALALHILARSPAREAAQASAILAHAAGVDGMAGGQAIDLASVGKTLALPELETMHRMKTGAMITAAVRLGVLGGRPLTADESMALDRFCAAAGLAFQVVDDVLDVEGSAETLGKTAGKDAAAGKPTYVAIMGLAAAREYALTLREQAQQALVPFGNAGRRLAELADWIVLRKR